MAAAAAAAARAGAGAGGVGVGVVVGGIGAVVETLPAQAAASLRRQTTTGKHVEGPTFEVPTAPRPPQPRICVAKLRMVFACQFCPGAASGQ